MEKNSFKYVIDTSMLAAFLLVFSTGVIKFKYLMSSIGVSYQGLPMREISMVHDWSGLMLGILILIHLSLNFKWLAHMTKKMSGRGGISLESIITMFLVLFLLLLTYLMLNPPVSEEIKELQEVEVRDYQGERLSSIADFRENSIKGPQHVDMSSYKLEITGLVEGPTSYTYEEALQKQKYSKVVSLYCVEGWDVTLLWEGVLVEDLLEQAGPKPEADTVIFHAYDGYTTSLPLDYILDKDIMLAYKMNGVVLPPERGHPFQLVAEDKWGYKWIKWVTEMELSDDPDYRGYWESAGYNQQGDVTGPIFD